MTTSLYTTETVRNRAKSDKIPFLRADSSYGRIIESVRGNAPRFFVVGHILRVNHPLTPNLLDGFLRATIDQARDAGLEQADMSNPLKCAFAFCRDLNVNGVQLYNSSPSLYEKADVDFWQTAYLRQTLGYGIFKYIWDRVPHYTGATYNEINKYIRANGLVPTYTTPIIQKLVLNDLEYVKELWKLKGPLVSEGFGVIPHLDDSLAAKIFMEKT